jgi:glycosyltransferase involved in cell wall biosynthesis
LTTKLRVLFAIGEMSGGGSQRQLVGILQRLDRSRFAPQLYVVSRGGALMGEVPADVPVHVFPDDCRPPRWSYPGQAHRARVRHLATVLERERIDVVYDRTYHMTLITAGAVRRRPTPRVSVIVTDPARDFATNRERFRFVKRLLLARAYRTADRVVAVSEGVRTAAIEHYGLAAERTLTLYNLFDIERADRLMREPLPPDERRRDPWFEVVAAGRLHPQKGFDVLLAALRDLVHDRGLTQLHLRILGTGELESALRQSILEMDLAANVTLAGFRPNPLPYFRQADLFCLPSRYEGMPNALVEAMLCGTPVLATDCPSGPREILAGGTLGRLVPPANAGALADAIADAVSHPECWKAITPQAREHIKHHFSPERRMPALESLLAGVAHGR